MSAQSQFELLRQRRFAPLFWVQFLGAANDNFFKFSFTLLATYAASAWGGVDRKLVGVVIGGRTVFILSSLFAPCCTPVT